MRAVTTVLAVLLLLGSGLEAMAQVSATVTGTVTDASGALIPGVEVTATNVNTGILQSRITNETGSYNFPSLQAGTYSVSAALTGFQTQTFQNVTLSQAQQVRLNFRLEVAAVGQTVEVTVDADVALATTSSSVGDVLPEIEVANLPLAERDVFDLLGTMGGAVGEDGRWSFGGQRSSAVNVTRDGMLVNDTRYLTSAGALTATYSSPDLVEEVQLVVGAVDAEAGRGSGQVALQTRSGTNGFHGALFYSNNNSALNANTFFNNLRGRPKDYLNRTQFGGRLAGPIIRNKLFFFVLTDNQRYVRKEDVVATVLTQQARDGIFRYMDGVPNANALQANSSVDLQGNVLNPANLRSFNLYNVPDETNRKGPSTHPYLQRVLSAMPLPNDYTVGDGLNTAGHAWSRRITGEAAGLRVGNNTRRNQFNYRLDYQVNVANRVSFINSREENFVDSDNPQWPTGIGGKTVNEPGIWTASWTSTITPSVLNDLRVGWKKTSSHNRSPFEVGCCFGKEFDDRDPEADELFRSLPTYNGIQLQPEASIWGDGIAGHGFGSTRGQDSPTYQIVETVSWTKGVHSFKGGFEYIWNWSDGWNTTSEQFPEALLGNGGAPVRGINSGNFRGLQPADATRAEQILNDLAGSINTIEQGFVVSSATQTDWNAYGMGDFRRFRVFHQNDYAFYLKDTWKVTDSLTLNLGIRYDMYGSMFERNGLATSTSRGAGGIFSISGSGFENWWYPNRRTDAALTDTLLVGKHSPNPNELFWPNDRNNWAPSVGFSYAMPDNRTVIRAGAGVNYAGATEVLDYELNFGNVPGSTDIRRFSPGQYIDFSNVGTIFPLSPATNPFAPATLTERTGDFDVNADDRKTPYVYNWQLSVQRELANNLILDASYIGNKGTQLFQVIELNEPDIFAAWQGQTFLEAFNQTRAGGNAALFDTMLRGINLGAGTCGAVNGTTCTGSSVLRDFGATDNLIADGEVAELARFINSSRNGTGVAGGLLRRNGLPENFIMVSPQFSDAQIWGTGDNSTYHSMQVQLRKRLSQGFSGQLSYTWSKALGNAGGAGTAVGGADNEAIAVLDPRNRRLTKARLGWDRTHQWNAHGTWELPFGPGRMLLANTPNWVARLVEGWQISSILAYQSGAPLSIAAQSRTVSANPGTFQATPNLVGSLPNDFGKVTVTDRGVDYFQGLSRAQATADFGADPDNLAAHFGLWNIVDSSGNVILANPEAGEVGTLGIRYLSGPARLGLDLSLQKRFQLTETTGFTLRGDVVDVLNTPQWADPNVNMSSASFGQITSASGSRRFTLNVRIDF